MKIKIALSIILIFTFTSIFSQNLPRNKYIIMTYVDDYSKGFHGKQNYSWVIPVDSITSFQSILYPFYFSQFSKSQFADCVSGSSVDPAIPSLKPGDYDFDSTWNAAQDDFENLYKTRKLIQTIKKIKYDGSKETIKIYATPIIAALCSCDFRFTIQSAYKGKIFLAGNFLENYSEFWESDKANFILKQDFSNLNFKRIRYPQ